MEQDKIRDLLLEAARLDYESCDPRINEIQVELYSALSKLYSNTEIGIIEALVGHLFLDTLEHRPECLLGLLPFFALVCGDQREHIYFADIDWSLVT